ncbi:MAG: L-seryl-tRNA(Sec) selenium transferase [Pirellulaceae bacterium]|nr:L-seryl-tRNA(Sec) selenium transferase [Pirellulaceae bacterium]
MNRTDQLRSLPSVDEVLRWDLIEPLTSRLGHDRLVRWIRAAIESQRKRILSGDAAESTCMTSEIMSAINALVDSDHGQSLQRVINATGIMLHTNLGRAPLAQRAIDRVNDATAFANVELDLASGKRSKRGKRVMELLAQLTGAEDAVVVNNCAAATMLVLQAVAGGREVIISRGQLVEIGGGFRLPNVFAAAGVELHEVGTTNRTYVRDYEAAINDSTGAILRVHHSNFRLTGFVTEPTIAELIAAKRSRPDDGAVLVPVIDDVGSGCIGDLSRFDLHEPNVIESVAAGADLTLFSGDKLFGGPQAGIVVGQKKWIDQLRANPLMRAMRVDKMTLAALEATAEIHLEGKAGEELPLMKMLCKESDTVADSCRQIVRQLGSFAGVEVDVVESESQVGGGSVPGVGIPSAAIKISGCKVDQLATTLRSGRPAVQARVADDSLWLDLRTVADDELQLLATRLADALARVAVDGSV